MKESRGRRIQGEVADRLGTQEAVILYRPFGAT